MMKIPLYIMILIYLKYYKIKLVYKKKKKSIKIDDI